MNSPRNTTSDVHDNPIGFLADALGAGGASAAIEAQELAGQAEMLRATTLPSEIHGDEAEFTDLGFTFGDHVPGDPLFREATLPEGWTREGSEHAMWSYLHDERGVRRAAVFYKAAFYDRRAHMSLLNVGYDVATTWIYGDDEARTLNPNLTDTEAAAARTRAVQYLEDAERHPTIYKDPGRAVALIAAVDAR